MEIIPYIIGIVYFVFIVAALVLLVYFIVKRVNDKKKETFEKRDS